MWLPWQDAAELAGGLAVGAVGARRLPAALAPRLGAVAGEAAVVAGLYSVWQLAGTVAVMSSDGALARARSIWRLERLLHLPSELAVQRLVLPHPWLVQAANRFYEVVHGTALLVFLVWLFFAHRRHYPHTRNVIALVTGASLAIQLVPVAPPRMLDNLGFVDTGLLYHQSVYTALGRGMAYQLSAMPSVHVAWAVIIAVVVVRVGTSPWRWWIVAHPVLTVAAVVVTANHFWLDGVVAMALIVAAEMVLAGCRATLARLGSRHDAAHSSIVSGLDRPAAAFDDQEVGVTGGGDYLPASPAPVSPGVPPALVRGPRAGPGDDVGPWPAGDGQASR
ncbi:MAG: phosphatase PAP2 family protein [Acidimicrobiales bacterium]